MGAGAVIDSWWVTGLFALACILSLVLFDPRTIGPWYSLALAGLVVVFVVASGLSSAPLTLAAMAGLIILVAVGVLARRSRKRDTDGQG